METPSLFEQAKSPVTASASALTEVPAVLSVGVFQKAETEQASASLEPVKASWFSRVKQIFSRKKAATAAVRPVQTEWTLDRVKVVRNDLSDCDLDVVVAGLQAEPARAKGKSLVGRAWKKVEVPVEKLQPAETLK